MLSSPNALALKNPEPALIQRTLFAYYNIELLNLSRTSAISSRRAYLAVTNRSCGIPQPFYSRVRRSFYNQLSLLYMGCQPPNIPSIAPGRSHIYLDHGVCDTFRGDNPGVRRAAGKLEREGVVSIEQLVRMSENDLLRYPFMNLKIVDQMRQRLQPLGLGFGMIIPHRLQVPPSYRSF